ncbi:conserved hypothetical protein [Bathymodiolus platifrons methanotrophic gill symbiont]|uniref:hypothetical protein n=1 Tax=Bathymodiolus platifrons methanotrophic gill symbiont TaxID=113268 RepID=UPI000B40E83C|nr:hypothetical protein [Bathymodiolus platifrons methanotrophic gill symbiont]GAW87570.1 conserved hypothetical protein [Bathymodiolus platifrons methanotrophic gill symbiont]
MRTINFCDRTGFRIRVSKELRQEFVYICRAQGKTAAQVVREFMAEYADKNRQKIKSDFFEK